MRTSRCLDPVILSAISPSVAICPPAGPSPVWGFQNPSVGVCESICAFLHVGGWVVMDRPGLAGVISRREISEREGPLCLTCET